jgi:hypothetical protein
MYSTTPRLKMKTLEFTMPLYMTRYDGVDSLKINSPKNQLYKICIFYLWFYLTHLLVLSSPALQTGSFLQQFLFSSFDFWTFYLLRACYCLLIIIRLVSHNVVALRGSNCSCNIKKYGRLALGIEHSTYVENVILS